MDVAEINNNLRKIRKQSFLPVSTTSSASLQSDSGENGSCKLERKASLQEIIAAAEDKKLHSEYTKKCRSMSDGAAKVFNDDPSFQVFPSLPNNVLEKLGLRGDGPRERLSEEESEQKFTSLSLAFAIDAATIKDRCERQRRYRDQTEINLSMEIDKLKSKLALVEPMCTDIEKAELLSTLFTQIDIVMNATSLVSISAERYGSVQHEERLTESVNLMVNHVQLLKQQRDSARRQLQYTKRVLQNVPESPTGSPINTTPTSPKTFIMTSNRKVINKRRASIATFSQPLGENNKILMDMKKFTKRTTDLSLRATSATRPSRPNRLELVGDLVKIKEGFVEPTVSYDDSENISSDYESLLDNNFNSSSQEEMVTKPELRELNLKERIQIRIKTYFKEMEVKYKKWTDDGYIHEVCCFCALICFIISLLIMVNIIIEYEYSKIGKGSSYIFWLLSNEK